MIEHMMPNMVCKICFMELYKIYLTFNIRYIVYAISNL